MDIERLYKDYNIPFVTGEDRVRGCRDGWTNTACPYCTGNPGWHLGWENDDGYFVCWRCGGKKTLDTFAALLRIPISKVPEILRKYNSSRIYKNKTTQPIIKTRTLKVPKPMLEDFPQSYRRYLERRNFDPDKIMRDWNIKATGIISLLDGIDYKRRIFIPMFWDGEMVTFQGRDITDKHPFKYLACPEEREKRSIKRILYGKQSSWGDFGIAVEGATDVWRLGDKAFGLLGIKYKTAQVRLIAKQFKRVAILFDPDPQAQMQAKRLTAELQFRGVDCFMYSISNDPGSMRQDDADALVRELQTYKRR